jgi:GTP-binding protein
MKKTTFNQARFIASAFDTKSFPKMSSLSGDPLPEIAIVGRSNVGKSSLINHLLKTKLAKTSSTPGKTQSINFYAIDEQISLVDLPGYGYAQVSKPIRDQWAGMIDEYLQKRSELKLILFLIDSRREPTQEDCAFVKWAVFHRKPVLFVFTKTDKLSEAEKQKNIQSSIAAFINLLPENPPLFLPYSIKDPHARMEIIKKINTLMVS